jgi:PAS domain S-box-containing protein
MERLSDAAGLARAGLSPLDILGSAGPGGLVVDAAGTMLHTWGLLARLLDDAGSAGLSDVLPKLQGLLDEVLRSGEPSLCLELDEALSGCMARAGACCRDGRVAGVLAILFENGPVQHLTRELDAIIESSSDGLFVCDGKGRILYMNPASARINHALPEKVIGRDYLEVAREGYVILPSAALESIRKRAVVSLLQENRYGLKLISTATPVFDDDGTLIRVVVSEHDITEMERLQRQLEEQQAIGDRFRDQVMELQQERISDRPVIARSPAMVRALRQALKLSKVDSTVLILGESGVGKGLIADLIHQNSPRAERPVIKINCGAIPEPLIEAELFGYERGAFTGAATSKPGHLELADGGTLFLDEIAELPLASQVKLLRFMEDGQVTRLGGTRSRKVDVRILAATNRDLDQLVQEGLFRVDLFYRLSVIPLRIPALRERRECLVPLIRAYVERFARRSGCTRRLTASALDHLANYPFPGNVRELMNVCERLVVMSDAELIDVSDLPQAIFMCGRGAEAGMAGNWPDSMSMHQIMESVERAVLVRASRRWRRQHEIAAALDMSQPTIARKLHKYGISLTGHDEA